MSGALEADAYMVTTAGPETEEEPKDRRATISRSRVLQGGGGRGGGGAREKCNALITDGLVMVPQRRAPLTFFGEGTFRTGKEETPACQVSMNHQFELCGMPSAY